MASQSNPHRQLADYKKNISWGIWFTLHSRAALADYDGSYQEYEKLFRHLCKVMGCECEHHCKEMLDGDPLRNYLRMKNKDGKNIGCLYHSWRRHNDVNARLGKPEVPFEQVEALYIIRDDYVPCNAPQANIDSIASKFPGLVVKEDLTEKPVKQTKRFQFVKVS